MSKNIITLFRKGQSKELWAKICVYMAETGRELNGDGGQKHKIYSRGITLLQFADWDMFSRKELWHETLRINKIHLVYI